MRALLWLMLAAAVLPLHAQKSAAPGAAPLEPLLPDSSNFVTASLLLASPSNEIYTCLGHCSIRMECPTHGLDYVYTLETDVQTIDFFKFFSGQANAAFFAVPTAEFLPYYSNNGRRVMQYELNLTHHEKQRLWQLLDEDMVAGVHRKFNFLTNNCASAIAIILRQALIDADFDYGQLPQEMTWNYGKNGRYVAHNSPWFIFISMSIIGTVADDYLPIDFRLDPNNLLKILNNSKIVNSDNSSRKVLNGSKEILPLVTPESTSALSPRVVFGALLAFVLIVTLLEWKRGCRRLADITDATLLTLQTLCGLFLLYVTTVSCLFGLHWNWYLIVFNPIPLILWLFLRKRRATMKRVYLCYTIILVAFIACTPLIEQLDLEHQLITAALATRTGSNFIAI